METDSPKEVENYSRESTVGAWELLEDGAICPGPDTEEDVGTGEPMQT